MRVFFLSAADVLTDQDANGEGLIAWNLLRELSERGHELVACVKYNRVVGEAPFEIVELGPRSKHPLLSDLAFARAAQAELQRRGPANFDIVHWLFPDGAYGLLRSQLPNEVPLIVGPLVSVWPSKKPWWPPGYIGDRLLRPWLSAKQRAVLATASRVLVTDEGVLSRLTPEVRATALEVPFGVRIEASDQPSYVLPNPPRILFVGRIEHAKGVIDLLDAASILASRLLSFELAFAGAGTLSDALPALASERKIACHVRLLGRLAPEQVCEEMANSSLLCLPSHGEPFGMVLLEAMRAGRAVVATSTGGPASIVVDPQGGRLVQPNNPSELAAALQTLLTDPPALERAGRFNRCRVEERYALATIAAQYEQVYSDAASERTVSSG